MNTRQSLVETDGNREGEREKEKEVRHGTASNHVHRYVCMCSR